MDVAAAPRRLESMVFIQRRSIPRYLPAVLAAAAMTSVAAADTDYVEHKHEKRLGEPTEDSALVYFVRPGLGHAAGKTWWFVDDRVVGVSKARGYSFALVPEGKHLFWMTIKVSDIRAPTASTPSMIGPFRSPGTGGSMNMAVLELEVERGQTYYLEIVSKPGVSGLVALDERQGLIALESCNYSELTPAGRTRGAEIVRRRMADVRKKAAQNEKRARKQAEKERRKKSR